MQRHRTCLLVFVLVSLLQVQGEAHARDQSEAIREITYATLPPEAQQTLQLIKRGGPYPYQRDGALFGNYERLLPPRGRGYYHEYTVSTPRAENRGARRIVIGRSGEYYYTDDHYRSFRRIRE